MALALPAMDLHGATWTNFAAVQHGMVQQPYCTFGTLPRPVMGPNPKSNVEKPQKFGESSSKLGGRNNTQLGGGFKDFLFSPLFGEDFPF